MPRYKATKADRRQMARTVRERIAGYSGESLRTDLIDVLCNLRHLCDREGWDFGELDREAYQHYILEIGKNV